jgi:hypothetical protein
LSSLSGRRTPGRLFYRPPTGKRGVTSVFRTAMALSKRRSNQESRYTATAFVVAVPLVAAAPLRVSASPHEPENLDEEEDARLVRPRS